MTKSRVVTFVGLMAALLLVVPIHAYADGHGKGHHGDSDDAGSFSNASINGTYSFRMTPATSFSAEAPGDPGGVGSAPRQDILRVGTFTADGHGGVSGHTLATTDTNNGATEVVEFTWTGTYNVNADGSGSLSINAPSVANLKCSDTTKTPAVTVACSGSEEGAETYSLVVNNHAGDKTVELTETDNVGGGGKIFLTAEAKRQKGRGDDNGRGDD